MSKVNPLFQNAVIYPNQPLQKGYEYLSVPYLKVIETAGLDSKRDLARLAGVKQKDLHVTNESCPKNLAEHLTALTLLYQDFFLQFVDDSLFRVWLKLENPLLGGQTPLSLFYEGQIVYVLNVLNSECEPQSHAQGLDRPVQDFGQHCPAN